MPSRTPRRRSAGGARLVVTLTAPDGASLPARGLAIWLANAAPANARGEVTVALISDARMRTLNRAYRNRDYATDVLSFPAVAKAMAGKPAVAKASTSAKASAVAKASADKSADRSVDKMAGMSASADQKAGGAGKADGAEALYLGDIVIATGVAQRQADDVGHPVGTEIKVLALHGLLHLLGYDHETDTGKMARLEARLRKKAGLEDGLIARRSR